ncbi:glycosyltransferase [Patescibacteria group bacterium]|nr:glycosyltransferase [Patescibacteria group bacterium]MBU1473183.1 glycosyltransferase [Patescibacteria group bacterium]MBU2459767.1 glycosyltransferase [Patescibacteria group bacterium]MBU2544279.1 glycosyltransferase [Patescibacteria group bacterium]
MKIGIDISQIVYEGTGVGRYVREMVLGITRIAPEHEYVLFAGTLRQKKALSRFVQMVKHQAPHVRSVIIPIPPTFLTILWNVLHVVPITWFTGPLDVFWSSDWTQPPLGRAVGMTTIHDVSFLRFPESFPKKIIQTQKQRLKHAVRINTHILCDSEATKKDIVANFNVSEERLMVVYPGVTPLHT